LKRLANRLTQANTGVEPLVCTQLDETSPDAATSARFVLINGHRRLAAAQHAGKEELRVRVLSHIDGRALTTHEQLAYWLVVSRSDKKPSSRQTVVGVVLWYRALSDADGGAAGTTLHNPTLREIADLLGIAVASVRRALRIASDPEEIVAAIVAQRIQLEAVDSLIDAIQDARQRVELVREVLRVNEQRRTAGMGSLTIRQILDLAQFGSVDAHTTEHERDAVDVCDVAERPTDGPATGWLGAQYALVPHDMKPPLGAPLEILQLAAVHPEANEVEILHTVLRDTITLLALLRKVDPHLSILPRYLRRPGKMLLRPEVDDDLRDLLANASAYTRPGARSR
jgi:hypothetical protein